MKHQSDGIRKAAILLDALDPKAAAMLLRRMGPGQAEAVKAAAANMKSVDPREQRRIVDEFLRMGIMVPKREPAGIELDGQPARRSALPSAGPAAREAAPSEIAPPFGALRDAEAEKLHQALAAERPQTVALVLSHLPPARAGDVLARLAPPLQAEVVRRLVDLEETSPEILREVETALQAKLARQVDMQRRRVAGLAAVAGILKASGPQTGAQVLDNLAAHDPALARRLGPERIDFDDFARLSDASLRAVFATAERELAVLALTGADPRLVRRVTDVLTPADARALCARLDNPGPVRLSDVEEARRRLGAHAGRLVLQGRIAAPGARRAPLAA